MQQGAASAGKEVIPYSCCNFADAARILLQKKQPSRGLLQQGAASASKEAAPGAAAKLHQQQPLLLLNLV